MTKQQFLDILVYLADYGSAADKNCGVGVQCAWRKAMNDAYQQKNGTRIPSWDVLFLYEITCKDVEHDTPLIMGDWVYRSYITRETYFLGLPAVSQYANFAADTRSRYTAGDNGVTIESLVTGKSYFVAYADIVGITPLLMQSTIAKLPNAGYRCYVGLNHYGFLRETPGVDELVRQAVKFDRWPNADFFY